MQKWINYGDVNFVDHGGTMVRKAYEEDMLKKYPDLRDEYEVLIVSPMLQETADGREQLLAYLKTIDLSDFRDADKLEMMSGYTGMTPEEITKDESFFAALCAEYVGLEPQMDAAFQYIGMYPADNDYIITKDDARRWLEELGAKEAANA